MDELREADVLHREAYQDFVIFEARPWYQQHLGRLYAFWDKWNQDYFGGALVTPYVLFSEPSSPQRLGDYARVSGFGGHGQVRLRPSLLTGSHPSVPATNTPRATSASWPTCSCTRRSTSGSTKS